MHGEKKKMSQQNVAERFMQKKCLKPFTKMGKEGDDGMSKGRKFLKNKMCIRYLTRTKTPWRR